MKKSRQQVSQLFQIQLQETNLSQDQIERIASAIRKATTKELLKMNFQIEELTPLFDKRRAGVSPCGGGCRAGDVAIRKTSARKSSASNPKDIQRGKK